MVAFDIAGRGRVSDTPVLSSSGMRDDRVVMLGGASF